MQHLLRKRSCHSWYGDNYVTGSCRHLTTEQERLLAFARLRVARVKNGDPVSGTYYLIFGIPNTRVTDTVTVAVTGILHVCTWQASGFRDGLILHTREREGPSHWCVREGHSVRTCGPYIHWQLSQSFSQTRCLCYSYSYGWGLFSTQSYASHFQCRTTTPTRLPVCMHVCIRNDTQGMHARAIRRLFHLENTCAPRRVARGRLKKPYSNLQDNFSGLRNGYQRLIIVVWSLMSALKGTNPFGDRTYQLALTNR
jgi:hypothetical protein